MSCFSQLWSECSTPIFSLSSDMASFLTISKEKGHCFYPKLRCLLDYQTLSSRFFVGSGACQQSYCQRDAGSYGLSCPNGSIRVVIHTVPMRPYDNWAFMLGISRAIKNYAVHPNRCGLNNTVLSFVDTTCHHA
jgi:hypothetical protein